MPKLKRLSDFGREEYESANWSLCGTHCDSLWGNPYKKQMGLKIEMVEI